MVLGLIYGKVVLSTPILKRYPEISHTFATADQTTNVYKNSGYLFIMLTERKHVEPLDKNNHQLLFLQEREEERIKAEKEMEKIKEAKYKEENKTHYGVRNPSLYSRRMSRIVETKSSANRDM